MNPLARLARRGQRPAPAAPGRLGGAEVLPGALTTLVRDPHDRPCDDVRVEDPYAADRFVVDPREWGDLPAAPAVEPVTPVEQSTTSWRLLGRLVLVVVLSLLAFRHSVVSLLQSVASGSALVYVLAVPLLAGLAAAASNRRPGFRVASGVRVTDVLLGPVLCGTALGVTTLLGPGLSGVYGLWRLDLLMLWLFLLGASVLCFGLRQTTRTWPFWAVLLLLWPFPVRLANAAVGSTLGGAVLLTVVVLAVAACGHRHDDPPRWQVLAAAIASAAVALALAGLTTHPQRLLWPAVVAAGVTALWWTRRVRGGAYALPVPEHRVRGTVPLLVALTVVGLAVLPPAPRYAAPSLPVGITSLSRGPLVVPGFTTTASVVAPGQQRFFGRTSTWQRVSLRAGDAATGAAPDGRALVVDVLSTPRPQVLELYPVVTTYPMGTLSSTPDAVVDLGHQVHGQLFRGEDVRHGTSYTLLTFTWRLPVDMSFAGGYTGPAAPLTQRVTLIAVDDHRPGARFPEPGNAALDGVRAALASVGETPPVREGAGLRADEQLLDQTARALVHQRLTGG